MATEETFATAEELAEDCFRVTRGHLSVVKKVGEIMKGEESSKIAAIQLHVEALLQEAVSTPSIRKTLEMLCYALAETIYAGSGE